MTALGIPPLRDEDGEPMAEEYPGQAFDALAARLAQHHAGGWAPDSIPGKQALAEFEAFVRETQARAVLRFASHQGITELTALQAVEYARLIREGRTDLAGRWLA